MKTLLKIEHGQLLKPHVLARHTDGYSPPPKGWTPEDIDDITVLAQEMFASAAELAGLETTLDDESWATAKLEAWLMIERQHYDANEPWAGWVPVVYQTDKCIGRAYRNLFVELNGGQCPPRRDKNVIYPPDGMYEFRNGKMSLLLKDEGEQK